jgi:hypothetical protein
VCVCGNQILITPLFRSIQGCLGATYRVAFQLPHPLDQKCMEIPFGFTRSISKNHKNYEKKFIYSMQHRPSWEANWFSASQENPRILGNPNVHYHIRMCPPPVPTLSQLNPVPTPTSYFLKIHLNIILPSMPGSPKWSLSLRFTHQNPVHASPLPHTCHMPHPSHSSRFYHLKNFGWGVQIIQLLIMQLPPLPLPHPS